MEELRGMFLAGVTALDRMRAFRAERVRLVCSGIGPRPLVGGGRLFVHVLPFSAFLGNASLDLREIHRHHDVFRPIGAMGFTPRFNLDGFVNERGGDQNQRSRRARRSSISITPATI